ncbi:hypothetical protein L210DRAFT_3535879 [Boletus edulis BED1]|uniref:Uncharacterized protein n=1 Tax=Boletus edulis BED1 TaxID=1328754 RepID=A0AAD4BWL3_BOLED|nr:hypothetical protein L210DRAFT_3535879 [Boletus edulis BED1]
MQRTTRSYGGRKHGGSGEKWRGRERGWSCMRARVCLSSALAPGERSDHSSSAAHFDLSHNPAVSAYERPLD